MVLRKLTLVNYGGIYNGMHLYDITIDFSRCRNRIIVLRGDNGSGKTTIETALKPLPDSNDCFISGKTAMKEIEYFDETANIIYSMKFIHECKPNGDRSNTKGYFKKIIVATGEVCELNPNGNITSCKDIIYEEFQLDPNYMTLTQLSSGNRGIADKRPADRKKYINSMLNSTEVYNDIHKKLSKKSLTYKGLMGSIVSKLDSIGDKQQLEIELVNINNSIESLSIMNTTSIKNKASAEGSIREIDADGSIMNKIADIDKHLSQYVTEYSVALKGIGKEEYDTTIDDMSTNLNNIQKERSVLNDKIHTLLETRELEASQLTVKSSKLQSLNSGINYSQCKSIIDNCKSRMIDIEQRFDGVDIINISQGEFVNIIDSLNSIKNNILSYEDKGYMLNVLSNDMTILEVNKLIQEEQMVSNNINADINDIQHSIIEYEKYEEISKILMDRPTGCEFDSCPFIKNALHASNQIKDTQYGLLLNRLKESNELLLKSKDKILYLESMSKAILFINNVFERISSFYNSLPKIIKNKSYSSPKDLVLSMINDKDTNDIFSYFYCLLDQANDIEEYKVLDKQLLKSEMELKSLESQAEFIELLEKDIANIQAQLDKDNEDIAKYNESIYKLDFDIDNLSSIIEYRKEQDVKLNRINKIIEDINILNDEKTKYTNTIEKINKYNDIIQQCDVLIHDTNIKLKPLLERRDGINYQLNLMTQYIQELEEYKTMYNRIESLKYYSSPTTGIQLLFASMYMNKIMDNANKLLCNLFNGKFAFLPFIISKDEFRIPVAVDNGINHEDITTMSSAEVMLLSMIISISLLSQTSTKLNIIVGDELDGPFDGDNRRGFFDILYKLMNLVSATQCVLISHNTELPSDCDVIVLKNENSSERGNIAGNIIWSYYN